jgi:hypothetical protein
MTDEWAAYQRCCVYAISDGVGNVKIGVAAHPIARRDSLQCGNAFPLQVLFHFWCRCRADAIKSEKRIHGRLHDLRISERSEWFRLCWGDAYASMCRESEDVVVSTREVDHIWWKAPVCEVTCGR